MHVCMQKRLGYPFVAHCLWFRLCSVLKSRVMKVGTEERERCGLNTEKGEPKPLQYTTYFVLYIYPSRPVPIQCTFQTHILPRVESPLLAD